MTQPKNIRPAAKPKPSVQVVDQFRRYADTPTFGYDLLNITVNGVNVQVYRACGFAQTPAGEARAIPLAGGFMCFSEAEADAYQKQLKAQAQKPRLIVPGSKEFTPPILH